MKMHGVRNIKIITMIVIYTAGGRNGFRTKIKFVEKTIL